MSDCSYWRFSIAAMRVKLQASTMNSMEKDLDSGATCTQQVISRHDGSILHAMLLGSVGKLLRAGQSA